MSQSASFYSVANSDFNSIRQSDDLELDIAPFVKDYCTLDESYMALEFTLVSGHDEEAITFIEEIFNPTESFGGSDFSDIDIDNIDPQALEAMVMNDASVYYLPPEKISGITQVLQNIDNDFIAAKYDPAALNDNDIYPAKWHNDNSPELQYNATHLQKSFSELKSFFQKAAMEKDYILTYMQG